MNDIKRKLIIARATGNVDQIFIEMVNYIDELEDAIEFAIDVLCSSCPEITKKQCIDFEGCYCLKRLNGLLKTHD